MPLAASRMYQPGATAPSWPWLAAGGGLLFVGIAAYLVSPKLGILALGLPAAPLLVLYPQLGLLGVIALIPFDSIASLVPSRTFTLTRLVGMAVMGGWVVNLLVRRERVTLGTSAILLLAYVAFALISLGWAPDPAESMQRVKTLVQLVLLYCMAVNLLRTPAMIERALDVLLVSTVLVSVVVILQYDPEASSRASLTLGETNTNPNYLAATLVGPAVAAAALGAARGRFGWWRFAAFGCLLLATIVTGSRGGLLALATGVAVIGVLRPRIGVRLALGVFLIVPTLPFLVPSQVLERQIERFQRLGEDRGSGRLDIWRVGAVMARENPVIGVGFGSFNREFYRYMYSGHAVVDPRWAQTKLWGGADPHNIYLRTAAELGAVGLTLLLLALAAHAAGVYRAYRRGGADRNRDNVLPVALLGMFAAFALMSSTTDTVGTKEVWLLLALMQGAALAVPGRIR